MVQWFLRWLRNRVLLLEDIEKGTWFGFLFLVTCSCMSSSEFKSTTFQKVIYKIKKNSDLMYTPAAITYKRC